MTSSLMQRFQVGSNAASWTIPGTYEHDFFVGGPASLRSLARSGSQAVEATKEVASAIERAHGEQLYALNEMRDQLERVERTLSRGFDDVVSVVCHLEGTLHFDLSEIKLLLAQSNTRLDSLAQILRLPRETEAAELIDDGVRAMAVNELDDAEVCLLRAVDRKRTSFRAHENLGFVYLRKSDADRAIAHFQKASRYATEASAQIFALENLARAHFAAEQFHDARLAIEQALEIRAVNNRQSALARYRRAVYAALAGDWRLALDTIPDVCRTDPEFFVVACTDNDLAGIREDLLAALNRLAEDTHARARRQLDLGESLVRGIPGSVRSEARGEMQVLNEATQNAAALLAAKNYSDSVRALQIADAVGRVAPAIPRLSELRRAATAQRSEAEQAAQALESARAKANLALGGEGERRDGLARLAEGIGVVSRWSRVTILLLPLIGWCKGCYDYTDPAHGYTGGVPKIEVWWAGLWATAVTGFGVLLCCWLGFSLIEAEVRHRRESMVRSPSLGDRIKAEEAAWTESRRIAEERQAEVERFRDALEPDLRLLGASLASPGAPQG